MMRLVGDVTAAALRHRSLRAQPEPTCPGWVRPEDEMLLGVVWPIVQGEEAQSIAAATARAVRCPRS